MAAGKVPVDVHPNIASPVHIPLFDLVDDIHHMLVGLINNFALDFAKDMPLRTVNIQEKTFIEKFFVEQKRLISLELHAGQKLLGVVPLGTCDRNRCNMVPLPFVDHKSHIDEISIEVIALLIIHLGIEIPQRPIVAKQIFTIFIELQI